MSHVSLEILSHTNENEHEQNLYWGNIYIYILVDENTDIHPSWYFSRSRLIFCVLNDYDVVTVVNSPLIS